MKRLSARPSRSRYGPQVEILEDRLPPNNLLSLGAGLAPSRMPVGLPDWTAADLGDDRSAPPSRLTAADDLLDHGSPVLDGTSDLRGPPASPPALEPAAANPQAPLPAAADPLDVSVIPANRGGGSGVTGVGFLPGSHGADFQTHATATNVVANVPIAPPPGSSSPWFFEQGTDGGSGPAAPGHHARQYIFSTIDPPGSTSTNLQTGGINDSGQIVGNYIDAGATTHGYLLSRGSYTTFDVPGSTLTRGAGINAAGQIVGRYDAGGRTFGFLLRGGLGGRYTTIDVPGSTSTTARAINNHLINNIGQIVGSYVDAGGTTHGFLLSKGRYTTIDVPGSTSTGAGGINASGQIAGNYDDALGTHGYLLSRGRFTTFDVPGVTPPTTFVNGINDSGQIIGSYDAGGTRHGFLLSKGRYTTIEVPGEPYTSALGINNSGQIVGTYIDAGGIRHGFFATPVHHHHHDGHHQHHH